MSTADIAHFVLVDFENVPDVDLGAVGGLPVHVTLLIGKNQKKLDLALVQQIHRLAVQVDLIEVGASGHNALDLTLAFYLGQAVGRAPAAHFWIVSRDKDFEPMIAHLRSEGTEVARCESFDALPFLSPFKPPASPVKPPTPANKKPPEDRHAKEIARLMNPLVRNRPSKKKALLAHIRTALGKAATDIEVEKIVRVLLERGALTIDVNDKVVYADKS